jgi:HAD superfamily hydrolase (TIGR01509 family)
MLQKHYTYCHYSGNFTLARLNNDLTPIIIMITTVFFDIGKVLVGFDHGLIWQRLAEKSPLSAAEIQQRIQGSGLMNLHEMGTLPPQEFFRKVCEQGELDTTLSYETFSRCWADIFWEQTPVVQLARTLQQHYTLGLLSNVGEIHWNWVLEQFSIFRQADIRILSFQVGAMKPAEAIYREAIRQSGSQPEQCVYIDDIGAYADASRNLGIYGIHYQSPEQLHQELATLDMLTT